MSESGYSLTQFTSEESRLKAAEVAAEVTQKPARKKTPPKLAVINQNGCTGCEICIVFCPADCIEIVPGPEQPQMQQVVEVDLDRCIGCSLCAKHCPWDTIDMITHDKAIAEAPSVTLRTVCGQKTVLDEPAAPAA